MTERDAFLGQIHANPADDTARLVFADWLDEHGDPRGAAQLRWWVAARQAVRAGVVWNLAPQTWNGVAADVYRIPSKRARRLFAVEMARLVRERYPLPPTRPELVAEADEMFRITELYALGLATGDDLATATRFAALTQAPAFYGSATSAAERAVVWWAGAAESAWGAAARAAARGITRAATQVAWARAAEGEHVKADRAARVAAWSAAVSIARILCAIPFSDE